MSSASAAAEQQVLKNGEKSVTPPPPPPPLCSPPAESDEEEKECARGKCAAAALAQLQLSIQTDSANLPVGLVGNSRDCNFNLEDLPFIDNDSSSGAASLNLSPTNNGRTESQQLRKSASNLDNPHAEMAQIDEEPRTDAVEQLKELSTYENMFQAYYPLRIVPLESVAEVLRRSSAKSPLTLEQQVEPAAPLQRNEHYGTKNSLTHRGPKLVKGRERIINKLISRQQYPVPKPKAEQLAETIEGHRGEQPVDSLVQYILGEEANEQQQSNNARTARKKAPRRESVPLLFQSSDDDGSTVASSNATATTARIADEATEVALPAEEENDEEEEDGCRREDMNSSPSTSSLSSPDAKKSSTDQQMANVDLHVFVDEATPASGGLASLAASAAAHHFQLVESKKKRPPKNGETKPVISFDVNHNNCWLRCSPKGKVTPTKEHSRDWQGVRNEARPLASFVGRTVAQANDDGCSLTATKGSWASVATAGSPAKPSPPTASSAAVRLDVPTSRCDSPNGGALTLSTTPDIPATVLRSAGQRVEFVGCSSCSPSLLDVVFEFDSTLPEAATLDDLTDRLLADGPAGLFSDDLIMSADNGGEKATISERGLLAEEEEKSASGAGAVRRPTQSHMTAVSKLVAGWERFFNEQPGPVYFSELLAGPCDNAKLKLGNDGNCRKCVE